jgi:HK97 family phage portal protein
MNFSLTLGSKTFSLATKREAGSLQSIGTRHGWLPWIQETSAGGWQRNEDVSVDTALRNPTLFACVTTIPRDIAKLRPMLVERDGDGVWTEVLADSPFLPVLAQPNSYQTWSEYTEWYITSKLLAGNVYVLKERDQRGMVRALYVLDPYRVTPLEAPDGSVFYQLTQDTLSQVATTVIVPAREIIHDRMCPLFHPLVGVSPIYAAGFPAIQGLNLRDAQDKFVSNGSRPGGILLVPGTMKQADVEAWKAEWTTQFSGANKGKIAVLTGGMSYVPMGMMTAEQSQVIEQAHMTDEDIAKCFGMPRHKVGIGPDPTYTNIQAKNQDYLNDCLQPHITRFNDKHTKGLGLDNVPGKTLAVELDLDDLLLMDMAAKAEAATKAVHAGLSYNEARFRFWDAGPVEGGETPMAQQQDFSLAALHRRDESGPAPLVLSVGSAAPARDTPTGEPATKQWNPVELLSLVQRKVAELSAA